MKPLKYVKIHWHDAQSVDDWTASADLKPSLALIETIGILKEEDDLAVVIALNYDSTNDNYSCAISIPKNCIVQKRIIKV